MLGAIPIQLLAENMARHKGLNLALFEGEQSDGNVVIALTVH
jgi:hypothetical protein